MKNLFLALAVAMLSSQGLAITPKAKKPTTIEYKKLKNQEPQMYLHEFPKMCYRGVAEDVPGLIKNMMKDGDSELHQDQGIFGYRFGDTMIVYYVDQNFATTTDEDMKSDFITNNEAETTAWFEYDIESKNVLLISNLGPQGDGTELYATIIKPCK